MPIKRLQSGNTAIDYDSAVYEVTSEISDTIKTYFLRKLSDEGLQLKIDGNFAVIEWNVIPSNPITEGNLTVYSFE